MFELLANWHFVRLVQVFGTFILSGNLFCLTLYRN